MKSRSPRNFFIALLASCLVPLSIRAEPPAAPTYEKVTLHLKRGDFVAFHFPAQLPNGGKFPKALVLFGSGGGGWSDWEDRFCHKLQTVGCDVMGVDFKIYAGTDYTMDDLQGDFQTLASYDLKPYGAQAIPLIIAGWSTGAEQAVFVAGGPHPPPGIVGLLLIGPGSWGGFGWFAGMDVGPRLIKTNTFTLAEFIPKIANLRVAQWHAYYDVLDSRVWLRSLKGPYREYDLNAGHDYGGASDEFLERMAGSAGWLLGEPDPTPTPTPK